MRCLVYTNKNPAGVGITSRTVTLLRFSSYLLDAGGTFCHLNSTRSPFCVLGNRVGVHSMMEGRVAMAGDWLDANRLHRFRFGHRAIAYCV